MNPLTDFATAGRELRARKNPNYEAACFHAQQCAEKYLKAMDARPHLEILNAYAVAVRYPGESADKPSAREAVRHATAVRTTAKRSLSLPA